MSARGGYAFFFFFFQHLPFSCGHPPLSMGTRSAELRFNQHLFPFSATSYPFLLIILEKEPGSKVPSILLTVKLRALS